MRQFFAAVLLTIFLVALPLSGATTVIAGDMWLEANHDAITLGDGAGATLTMTFDNTGTDVVLTVTTDAFNVSTGVIQQAGTPVVLETRTITGGVGIAAMGALSADRTVTFDATELDALTWDAGDLANYSWSFSLSGASDPVMNFADGVVNLTTGSWQVGGVDIVLDTLTLSGGDGIVTTIGDLSTNRTITAQLLDANDGTGVTFSDSGLEFGDTGDDELALLQGCAEAEILKWDNTATDWECQPDVGASQIDLATQEELTIATGIVTSTCAADNICAVDITVESPPTPDQLTTFNCTVGALMYLRANDTADTVILQAHSGPDFSLDSTEDYAVYLCDTSNLPELISRSNGG